MIRFTFSGTFTFIVISILLNLAVGTTLTFVPRHIDTTNTKRSSDGARVLLLSSSIPARKKACECVQTMKRTKTTLLPGTLAMLHVANKHARSMAARGRLYQPPVRTMNSRKALPCGTFLSGASVGRAIGTDSGATCARLYRQRRGASSLHVVIGSHRSSDGVVWCVTLFGVRTRFQSSGACERVGCHENVA